MKLKMIALAAALLPIFAVAQTTTCTTQQWGALGEIYDGTTRYGNGFTGLPGSICRDYAAAESEKQAKAAGPGTFKKGFFCHDRKWVETTCTTTAPPAPALAPAPVPVPPPAPAPAPAPTSPGLGRLPTPSVFHPGWGEPRITTTSDRGDPARDGVGAFRTVCQASHFAFDDPIVYPGQPGRSHLHMFFGNTRSYANSTIATMSTSGNGTCAGGTLNRSSYWIPALIDTTTGLPVMPIDDVVFYYKAGYRGIASETVRPIPKDLRMIAGDTMSRLPGSKNVYQWVCHNNYPQNGPEIQNCAVGDDLELRVFFPQCWDGENLDSPDHKSHMAYGNGSGCPAGYPVTLPEVSLNIRWAITRPNQSATWRLSSDTYTGPAGYSAHADFWGAWDTATMQTLVTHCINARKDCHALLLGNGQTLY